MSLHVTGADRPQHLKGSNEKLSGNRGFDPLSEHFRLEMITLGIYLRQT